MTSPTKTALIVVDHGSRREAANALLSTVVAQLESVSGGGFVAVEPAHMELAEPTLESAFERCVEAGAQEIAICLFFLSPGRHARGDIPRMTEALRQKYPHIRCVVTDPLAPDLRLAELLLQRAQEALAD